MTANKKKEKMLVKIKGVEAKQLSLINSLLHVVVGAFIQIAMIFGDELVCAGWVDNL